MKLQIIQDSKGKATGVYIPISELPLSVETLAAAAYLTAKGIVMNNMIGVIKKDPPADKRNDVCTF